VCGAYKKKHGRVPVLVLDNFNLLLNLKGGREYVEFFQDFAKTMADGKLLVVVFVSSDGSVPNILSRRSSVSRMAVPIEIGDLNEEDAINYLRENLCPTPTPPAEK